ncbi:hypothetical protein D0962_36185 [Leptolyngbyaceae cyanobacterium CCMR0082]|uniref:Uncharacterized protein n=1 Tax=Adonisia turfae CCMR0082 TaxID=2304604 RepID=A0A6M0SHQ9_9CYAN|nr:hypothetical protein [Adonisia turfae]NEZ68110.1 hypothetical protein [Adonisia turfae CCMR0082]
MAQVLKPDQSYTFSKIFELKILADELAQELGYTLSRKRLDLPRFPGGLDRIQELCDRIEEILPYVNLASETSRREVLYKL